MSEAGETEEPPPPGSEGEADAEVLKLLAIYDQIKEADIQAILVQVQSNKPLTAAQKQRLDEYLAEKESADTPPQQQELTAAPGVFVETVKELAEKLGCDRKTVQRYMKQEGNPGSTEDGKFDVQKWQAWVEANGKQITKRHKGDSKADEELRKLKLQNERLRIENDVRLGNLISVDEVCKLLTEMTGGFSQEIRGIKHTLAPQVVGVSVGEASKRIGRECEVSLSKLALGDWAKKKPFWARVSAHLSDLHKKFSLGDGASATS